MNRKHLITNMDRERLIFIQKICNLSFLLGFVVGATIVI
jgi:hypothetical protein